MVRGRDDDELCTPLDLVTASREAGIKPPICSAIASTGPRCALCCSASAKSFATRSAHPNEAALQRVRDKSPNGMATVAAVRALEDLTDEAAVRDGRSAPHRLARCGHKNTGCVACARRAPASNIIDLTPQRSAQVSTTDFGDDGDVIPPSFRGRGRSLANRLGTLVAIISQLNTLPACAPVNASMAASRLATHDSGSGWLAMPFLYDSFIHYSTPVLSRRTTRAAKVFTVLST